MIRIDITPVVIVTTVKTSKVKGREVRTEERSRQYSAIARRGDEALAEVTVREGMSAISAILKKLGEDGTDMEEIITIYRGQMPIFVPATLGNWLAPPKKERKKNKKDHAEDAQEW